MECGVPPKVAVRNHKFVQSKQQHLFNMVEKGEIKYTVSHSLKIRQPFTENFIPIGCFDCVYQYLRDQSVPSAGAWRPQLPPRLRDPCQTKALSRLMDSLAVTVRFCSHSKVQHPVMHLAVFPPRLNTNCDTKLKKSFLLHCVYAWVDFLVHWQSFFFQFRAQLRQCKVFWNINVAFWSHLNWFSAKNRHWTVYTNEKLQ